MILHEQSDRGGEQEEGTRSRLVVISYKASRVLGRLRRRLFCRSILRLPRHRADALNTELKLSFFSSLFSRFRFFSSPHQSRSKTEIFSSALVASQFRSEVLSGTAPLRSVYMRWSGLYLQIYFYSILLRHSD
jgi:hypothetical protein